MFSSCEPCEHMIKNIQSCFLVSISHSRVEGKKNLSVTLFLFISGHSSPLPCQCTSIVHMYSMCCVLSVYMCVCVCACVCGVCACVCVRACVRVWVHACVHVSCMLNFTLTAVTSQPIMTPPIGAGISPPSMPTDLPATF